MLKEVKTIAIIDSGLGGVSVLKALLNKYKAGNFIYYIDNKNMPYGNKTKDFIASNLKSIIKMLKSHYAVDVIVVACNTASCILKEEHLKDVVCLEFDKEQVYYATPLTKKVLKGYKVIADKNLASQIENCLNNKQKIKKIIKQKIKQRKLDKFKTLILACTHFELVKNYFKEFCPNTKIVSNSDTILNKLIVKGEETNIIYIQSKNSLKYENEINKLVRS